MRSIVSFWESDLFKTVLPFVDDQWGAAEKLLTALYPFLSDEAKWVVRDSPLNAFKPDKELM